MLTTPIIKSNARANTDNGESTGRSGVIARFYVGDLALMNLEFVKIVRYSGNGKPPSIFDIGFTKQKLHDVEYVTRLHAFLENWFKGFSIKEVPDKTHGVTIFRRMNADAEFEFEQANDEYGVTSIPEHAVTSQQQQYSTPSRIFQGYPNASATGRRKNTTVHNFFL